jgi:starvation-inducible DNA-binding protein
LDTASKVAVGKNITTEEEGVQLLVNSLNELLILERGILNESADANDEGTNAMMSDLIAEQEKTMWMLNAWLN